MVAAPFIFLPLLLLLAVFWHIVLCRSRARSSCAFYTWSNSASPGDHGTVLVLNGWRMAFLQFKLPMAHFFSPTAKWVCFCSWVQWLLLQMLKCLQRKQKVNKYWYYGLHFPQEQEKWQQWISAVLFLYLSACKVYNFWSAVSPICEFICLGVAGDK